MVGLRTRGAFWGMAVALVLVSSATARAQEHTQEAEDDRMGRGGKSGHAGTEERGPDSSDEAWAKAPPSTYDYGEELPPPDVQRPGHTAPPPLTPPGPNETPLPSPSPAPAEPPPPSSILDGIKTEFDGRVRLELGYDSNVFRSEHGLTSDEFVHGFAEANALVRFKESERELFANVTAEGFNYFDQWKADEMYVSSFLDYYHPLTFISPILDLDIQNTVEYSRQKLLDDNGDLLPREDYNALEEEIHVALVAHLGEHISWDVGGGFRYKDFENNIDRTGPVPVRLASLDFEEYRGDTGLRFKIPWWADGRLKLRYIFRQREYSELIAQLRNGDQSQGDPTLELRRHQLKTSYSQKLELFDTVITATVGYSFTYNQDTFEGDRSYREHSGSARIEWWLKKDTTRFEAELRGGTRSFLIAQRQRANPSIEPQDQSYIDVSFLFWQKLIEHVALVGEIGFDVYNSDDSLIPSYRRVLVQLGVEASF